MTKTIVTIIIILSLNTIVRAEEVNLNIIAMIESHNNPLAYNKRSGASGMYQLMPCVVKDYNQHNHQNLPFRAVFSPSTARTIANWYLSVRIPQILTHYGLKDTLEHRLWAYNAGIGRVKRNIMPKETRQYINKYRKLREEIRKNGN